MIFDDFMELHGDRMFADDKAICGGIALLDGLPVTVIGHDKGRDLEERKQTNFAMAHPEGYHKALRLAHQAEKFGRPIVFFVDTPGAFCGIGAEERGQSGAIAQCLFELIDVKVPMVMVVIGEGGSGGALALGVCDRVAMLSNALYSILSPKGFASLVWKDPQREDEAADIMKITPEDLKELGVIDEIIPEAPGGAHRNHRLTATNLKRYIVSAIDGLRQMPLQQLLDTRYDKFRKMGQFNEN